MGNRKDAYVTKGRGWRTRVLAGDLRTLVCIGRSAVTRAGDVSRCRGGRVRSRHHANNRGWPGKSLQRFAGIHLPARSGGCSDRNRRPCIFGGRWSLCSLGANLGRLTPALKRVMRVETPSRSAKALLPPHKCGGSHHPFSHQIRRSPRGELRAQSAPCRHACREI
jgi:hypothetical protein